MVLKLYLSLQRVFHSIRFKVNKGWVTAVTLFLSLRFVSFMQVLLFAFFF